MSAPSSPSLAMRAAALPPPGPPASTSSTHLPPPLSPQSGSPPLHAARSSVPQVTEEPVASSSRRSFPSTSTSTPSSTPSSSYTSAFPQRQSFSTNPSTAPTSPEISSFAPHAAAPAARTWRRTANVPQHIHRRHAMRGNANVGDEDGERNRWLSEDEGIGGSTVSGRRRRRSWDRGGPDRGHRQPDAGMAIGSDGLTVERHDGPADQARRKSEGLVAGPTSTPKAAEPRSDKRRNQSQDRPVRGSIRRTHSFEPSSASATPDPPTQVAAVTLAHPQQVGENPPRIADLISPRSPVVMTHSMSMTPVGSRDGLVELDREASPPLAAKLAARTSTGFSRRGSAGDVDVDDPMGEGVDETERELNKSRKDTLGRLQELLGCILCPPDLSGAARPLHHPITLPCGHTLSAAHLALPAYQLLGPSSPPTIDQSSVAAAQQARQLQQQRLNHWASLMCPIPSCKRYSPSASPGIQLAEISDVTVQMAQSQRANSESGTARGELLASGVQYYPPQATATASPPAYELDPTATAMETGEHSHPAEDDHHSILQDVIVEKILRLVQIEQKKMSRPAHSKSGRKPQPLEGTSSLALAASLERSHIDPPASSSNTVQPVRPAPLPLAAADPSATGSSPNSDDSLASQSMISKRPRNDAHGGMSSAESVPSPYEWDFQRELMGLLECDVCAMLLYEPVTTPCQHSFCAKCLSRSLDHSSRCPVCRQDLPSFAFFQDHSVNRVILSAIKTVFPAEYIERKAALERDERDAQLDTPIFVCTLAFPGMPTILHVFEPRYRLMIRRCIESSSPRFGMVLPSRPGQGNLQGVMEYGTMLEIQSVQMLPDGRSMVETVGTHRFKLLEKGNLDGYTIGRTERIDDIGPEEEAAREQEAVQQASALREQFRMAHLEAAQAAARASGDVATGLPTVQAAIALSIPSGLSGQPQAVPMPPAVDAVRTEDAAQTTEEYMTICRAFIEQLRSGSAPWLLQRLNNTYGTMPDDPSEFSYWMALVMPIDEYEKARLLPIRSPRLRLKLIAHWVESLRSSWWFSSGCVVG